MKIWRVIRKVFRYDNLMNDTEEFYSTYDKAITAFNEMIERDTECFRSTFAEYNDCKYHSNRSYDDQFYIVFEDNSERIVIYIEEVNVY